MNDKELLELAANAASVPIREWCWRELDDTWHGKRRDAEEGNAYWSPLTDDGDALRLAVGLDIVPRCINGVAFAWRDGVCDMQEPYGDKFAATRRAIVRAAAALVTPNVDVTGASGAFAAKRPCGHKGSTS